MKSKDNLENPNKVRDTVREKYGEIARTSGNCCGSGKSSCCSGGGVAADTIAKSIGYSEKEIESLPEGANMGLSCGNPTAFASLRNGEVVLDLGSGAGLDVFLAAQKVGKKGRVIGVDMTAKMISKARNNAIAFIKDTGLDNVEFRLGEIEHLPVADNMVDVVISNCVINLSPDKEHVWREIARILKPGGRVSVSDLALLEPLPKKARESVELLVGCIAGAVLVDESVKMARDAGLVSVETKCTSYPVDEQFETVVPGIGKVLDLLPKGKKPGDYVTSMLLTGNKPK